MSWSWRYLDADGGKTASGETAGGAQVLPPPESGTRSDAESWLGEHWRELAAAGVVSATLLDGERVVGTVPLTQA